MSISQLNGRTDRLCEDLIAEKWGSIAALPDELNRAVFGVYRSFISSYLNFLRQKESKPLDWIPEKLVIDWELVDDMRHFFSDYQHITALNRQLDNLIDIDKGKQPKLYQEKVAEILARIRE